MGYSAYDKYARWFLTLLFVTATVLRLAYALENKVYENPEDFENGAIARSLLAGKGFAGGAHLGPEGPTAFMAPFYPVFLAGIYGLFGKWRYVVIIILQSILAGLSCLLLFWLARRVSKSRLVPYLAALGLALSYFSIQIASWINVQVWTEFFLLAIVLQALRVRKSPSFSNAILLGLLFALGSLAEPVIIATIVPLAVWISSGDRPSKKMRLAVTALTIIVAGLIVSPWTIRNYVRFGRFIPIKSQFGYVLWWGSNPRASGGLVTDDGVPLPDTLSRSSKEYLASLDEVRRFDYLGRLALGFIRREPLQFLKLRARSFLYFWTGQNLWLKAKVAYEHPVTLPLMIILFGLAVAGVMTWARDKERSWAIIFPVIFYPIPYVVTHSDILYRYRVPIDPFLILFAALALSRVIGKASRVRSRESRAKD